MVHYAQLSIFSFSQLSWTVIDFQRILQSRWSQEVLFSAAPMLCKETVMTVPQIMNYLVVQLLLVETNFTLHLFFPFFCGILRFKWVRSKLFLSSMMPRCVTTSCYSEEGCARVLWVPALLISVSLWIYLRICETSKSLWLATNVITPLLWPWKMKGGCMKGERWSGSQLWVAVWHVCDLSAHGTFVPGGTRVLQGYIIPAPAVKHWIYFWNRERSSRQRECTTHGEWWEEAVLPPSTGMAQCVCGKCLGTSWCPGRAAKAPLTSLLWKQNEYTTLW